MSGQRGNHLVRGVAALCAGALLAACGGGAPGPGASSAASPGGRTSTSAAGRSTITSGDIRPWTQPADPESEFGLPPLRGVPAVARPEARVVTEQEAPDLREVEITNAAQCIGRVALEPRCQYRITWQPPPEGVTPGTVLVAGVTQATPAGLLVRVDAVEGSTILATEASLGEALESGEFRVEQRFTPDDVVSAELAEGVSALPAAVEGGRGMAAGVRQWLVGDEMAWDYSVDRSPAPGVHLSGEAHFNAGCGMDAGLGWGDPWFWAGCDLDQHTLLEVQVAKGAAGLGQTFRLADFDLEPIVFTIAAIPIVIVPHLTLAVRLDGSLAMGIDFGAEEHVLGELKVGYDDGFYARARFDSGSDSHHEMPGGSVGSKLGGELGVELMIYGILGPKVWGVGHVEFTGGPDERPTVCYALRAGLGVSVVLDLQVTEWEWRPGYILDKRLAEGCRANDRPRVQIAAPTAGQSLTLGSTFLAQFRATATDPEDGELPVRWSSDVDGPLGQGTGPVSVKLRTSGAHTITATAVDRDGASGTAVVHIVVTKPTWTLDVVAEELDGTPIELAPGAPLQGSVGDAVLLTARAAAPPSLAQPSCDRVRWSAQLPLQDLGACRARLTFGSAGSSTVSAAITTPWGDVVTDEVAVSVAAKASPSASPKPGGQSSPASSTPSATATTAKPQVVPKFEGIIATSPSLGRLYEGAILPAGEVIGLEVRYLNADATGVPVRYDWAYQLDGGPWVALPGPEGSPSVRQFSYAQSAPRAITLRCVASSADAGGELRTMTLGLKYLGLSR